MNFTQQIIHWVIVFSQWMVQQITKAQKHVGLHRFFIVMITVLNLLSYAYINTSLCSQYFDMAKQNYTTELQEYDLNAIGVGTKMEYIVFYYVFIIIMGIVIGLFKVQNEKIGKYTYNKQKKKQYTNNNLLVEFLKVSTIDTFFFLLMTTMFQGFNFFTICTQMVYLGVFVLGTYVIRKFESKVLSVLGTYGKGIATFLINVMNLTTKCHKITGNFNFMNNNNFILLLVVIIVFTVFQTLLDKASTDNFEKFLCCKNTRKQKKMELYDDYIIALLLKNTMKNLYILVIAVTPILLSVVDDEIWYMENPGIFIYYFVIVILNIILGFLTDFIINYKKQKLIK